MSRQTYEKIIALSSQNHRNRHERLENNEVCVETLYEFFSTVITFRNDVERLLNDLSFERDFRGDHFISFPFHIRFIKGCGKWINLSCFT